MGHLTSSLGDEDWGVAAAAAGEVVAVVISFDTASTDVVVTVVVILDSFSVQKILAEQNEFDHTRDSGKLADLDEQGYRPHI